MFYSPYNSCPICNSKLNKKEYFGGSYLEEAYLDCDNGCFYFEFIFGSYSVKVFDKEFQYSYNNVNEYDSIIEESIQYWKEDERYLSKILERG